MNSQEYNKKYYVDKENNELSTDLNIRDIEVVKKLDGARKIIIKKYGIKCQD